MKFFQILYVFFITTCIQLSYSCSCKSNSISEFDDIVEIKDAFLLFSDSTMGEIDGIMPWHNYIILNHNHDTCVFSMLDVESGEIIRKWGRKGHGRNESLSFGRKFHIQDSIMSYYDKRAKELCFIDLSKIEQIGNCNVRKESIPYDVDFRPSYIIKTDSYYYGIGHFKKGRIGCLDSQKRDTSPEIDYPFDMKGLNFLEKGMVYQGMIMYNKKQNKNLLITYCSDIFEIIQTDHHGRIYRSFVNSDGYAPAIKETNEKVTIDTKKSIAGFLNGFVDDKSIYLLYSSLTYDEVVNKDYQSSQILAFDWKGNKKTKYILPYDIQSFYVSKDYIVGVAVCNGVNKIYRFKI